MPLNLAHEVDQLAKLFDSEGIEYAFCGAIAVSLHGCPRSTQDIDVLILESDAPKIERLVARIGFTMSGGVIPFHFGKETERRIIRVSKFEGEEFLTLDLLLVTPIFEDVWAGREVRTVGALRMAVVSLEGLLKMKRLSGRTQDIADIERLKELHGK